MFKSANVNPLITVCIPVYETERFLLQCLESVYKQDFYSFEILIVSDASEGRDQKGRKAKRIVQLAQKECDRFRKANNLSPVKLRFIEHAENRGLIEVRRTLASQARGLYTTQVDSDDVMEAGALAALYNAAVQTGADIVHGTSTAGVFDQEGNFNPTKENRYGKIFYGTILGRDIFHRWLIGGEFTANTWGKLIKREIFLKAYEHIPYTECNMADDVLLFFFIAQYLKKYVGIENKVYRYRVNTGMSSGRKIDTIKKWKMICTTASVFTVISQWIENNKDTINALQADEVEKVRGMTRYYLLNNLKQMNEVVVPELKDEARALLCEYWGESFVERMEAVSAANAPRAANAAAASSAAQTASEPQSTNPPNTASATVEK